MSTVTEVFVRLPLSSCSEFSVQDLHVATCLAAPQSQGHPIRKIAGWIPGTVVEDAWEQTSLLACAGPGAGLDVEVSLGNGLTSFPGFEDTGVQDDAATFQGPQGREARWRGLVLLEPGSKLRLCASGSGFRLGLGWARNARANMVLAGPPASCPSEETEALQVLEWIEVSYTPSRKHSDSSPAARSASIELLKPTPRNCVHGVWEPLPRDRLRKPMFWPSVQKCGDSWLDSAGRPCDQPPITRVPPETVRVRSVSDAKRPAAALLVVLPANPTSSGVGGMTPNWELVAALEEALYARLGADYEMHVMLISEEGQLPQVNEADVAAALSGSERAGVVYFLCPQCVVGDFRTKSWLIHDVPFFALMERLERAGFPTIWPHPSHLYRILAGKEWPPHLCLSPEYRVPLTTRVPRSSVVADPVRAAQQAFKALAGLRSFVVADTARQGTKGDATHTRCVAKIGYSWKSEGVAMCDGPEELGSALQVMSSNGWHNSFLVQERIDGVVCEGMVFLLSGRPVGKPRYYRFSSHGAVPVYIRRREACDLLGGAAAQDVAEE
ncbi:unnamed protein product, partial [Polarella glacialis]